MNEKKIEQLRNTMQEHLQISDLLRPLLTETEAKRLMVYPDTIKKMMDIPEIWKKMQTIPEEEMNKGLMHGLAALDEIKRNLQIAQLRASGSISENLH
jgi:hypothetical protein